MVACLMKGDKSLRMEELLNNKSALFGAVKHIECFVTAVGLLVSSAFLVHIMHSHVAFVFLLSVNWSNENHLWYYS